MYLKSKVNSYPLFLGLMMFAFLPDPLKQIQVASETIQMCWNVLHSNRGAAICLFSRSPAPHGEEPGLYSWVGVWLSSTLSPPFPPAFPSPPGTMPTPRSFFLSVGCWPISPKVSADNLRCDRSQECCISNGASKVENTSIKGAGKCGTLVIF